MKLIADESALLKLKDFKLPPQLGFGKVMAPVMIEADYEDGKWSDMKLIPYGPIPLDPCSKVLHYAQEIFEGLKAYKTATGEIQLFRPELNAKRFNKSAYRMAMPEVPEDAILESVHALASYCSALVPEQMGASLYIRPFMIATQRELKVNPSNSYKYLVVASPSESYFSSSTPAVKIMVENEAARATPGGTGYSKTGCNYGQSLFSAIKMKEKGFDMILWLDAINKKYIEEMSGMNFCAIVNGELHTPELTDTILDGITRRSLLELAREMGITTKEYRMDINVLMEQIKKGECTEAFACGTAAIVAPVKSLALGHDGESIELRDHKAAPVANKLRQRLLNIQSGIEQGPEGWIQKITPVL